MTTIIRPTPPSLRDAGTPTDDDDTDFERNLARARDWAVIGLFGLFAFGVLKYMAELAVPMVAAVIFGSVLARIGDRFARLGIPPMVAALTLVALTGLIVFLVVDALLEPLSALVAQAPSILATLGKAVAPMLGPITSLKQSMMHLTGADAAPVVVANDTALFTEFLGGLTPAIGEFFVFFATLVFFVAGRVSLRRRMIMVWGDRAKRLAALRVVNAIEASLALYFGTTAMIYAGVGVAAALIAFAFGLANPVLWGALTFVASFIPYFGAALITLALAAGGLVTHNAIGWALLPAGAFLIVHLVSENAVIPSFLGHRLDVNPFVVFVAIVFWTWMWGPIGAVLAVPLLLVGDTLLAERRSTRPDLPE